MFSHQPNPQSVGESPNSERFSRHCAISTLESRPILQSRRRSRIDHIRITNNARKLGVSVPPLRTLVYVCRANNCQAIIHNHSLQNRISNGNEEKGAIYLGVYVKLYHKTIELSALITFSGCIRTSSVVRVPPRSFPHWRSPKNEIYSFGYPRRQKVFRELTMEDTYINPFLSKSTEDGVRPARNRSILAFKDDTNGTCVAVVDRKCKSW